MKFSTAAAVILALSLSVDYAWGSIGINNWTYFGDGTGQDLWVDIAGSYCGGNSQSPINILSKEAEVVSLPPFNLNSYDIVMPAEIENNGHAIEVDLNPAGTNGHFDITGGGLFGRFRAYQFHFHFGATSDRGSEHRVNNGTYPAEVHIVHYNLSYPNPSEALQHAGGIAVLGFFFEIKSHNPALDPILDPLQYITEPYSHHSIPNLQLSSLLPESLTTFWRYNGSLTTPLCNEVVVWSMFKDTIGISEDQLNLMRGLMSDAYDANREQLPMLNNYRFVQELNSREILTVVTSGPSVEPPSDPTVGEPPSPTPTTEGACQMEPLKILLLFAVLLSILCFKS